MTDNTHYTAILAEGSAVPTLLCGHCRSMLSRNRIFSNQGNDHQAIQCNTIGLCSADDCGALNCCDEALARIDNPERRFGIAS
ncbi:hypothetical protein [Marinobacter halophilus]|uniref:Uncharacterized protein n=1 Tax=Marinobacter halophilus TaxID=1323740 RepID=A0A2T1KB89_9GAMM|nr:hypothetical protein [Marinobacter halophilus]PSF07320.1 hypothetical protein C7H08_12695 [Marinobacter halophilus]GGC82042.1 hypothetical protein GCM10011362_33260 [Marinobacter halophilus]